MKEEKANQEQMYFVKITAPKQTIFETIKSAAEQHAKCTDETIESAYNYINSVAAGAKTPDKIKTAAKLFNNAAILSTEKNVMDMLKGLVLAIEKERLDLATLPDILEAEEFDILAAAVNARIEREKEVGENG